MISVYVYVCEVYLYSDAKEAKYRFPSFRDYKQHTHTHAGSSPPNPEYIIFQADLPNAPFRYL